MMNVKKRFTYSCNRVPQRLTTDKNKKKKSKPRLFLTCPCHEIYKDEAVGLKSCKYTFENTIYVNMWNLGQFRENLIFCQ